MHRTILHGPASANGTTRLRITPEITGVSLVLLGNFSPAIFTPAWFGWHELLPVTVVDVAELEVAQPKLTVFRAEWLHLQVDSDRFSISTTQPPFVRLRDMGIRIFREKLPHTRLRSLGINRQVHFLVNSSKERDRIGRLLAPVKPWGEWGKEIEPDGMHGGMTSLTMTQLNLSDRSPNGRLNVTVQPSTKIGLEGTGIYVEVNDHFVVQDPSSQAATSDIVQLIENNFDASIKHSEQIIDQVMLLREE